jgi:hypothetical protein
MCTACARHVHRMCTACARHVHGMCTACELLAGRAGPPPVLGARLPARPDPRATQLLDMRAGRGGRRREAAPRQPHRRAHGSVALTRRHGTLAVLARLRLESPPRLLAHGSPLGFVAWALSRATVGPRSVALEPLRGAAQRRRPNAPLPLRLPVQAQRCRSASVRWA